MASRLDATIFDREGYSSHKPPEAILLSSQLNGMHCWFSWKPFGSKTPSRPAVIRGWLEEVWNDMNYEDMLLFSEILEVRLSPFLGDDEHLFWVLTRSWMKMFELLRSKCIQLSQWFHSYHVRDALVGFIKTAANKLASFSFWFTILLDSDRVLIKNWVWTAGLFVGCWMIASDSLFFLSF
jgi:hypothetical protein